MLFLRINFDHTNLPVTHNFHINKLPLSFPPESPLGLALFVIIFIHTSFTCIYCENQTNLSDSLVFYQIFLYFLCYTYTYKLGFPRNRSSKKIKQQQKSTWVIFRDPSSSFATANFWTSEFKCGQTIYMVPHNGNCVKLQKPWVISYERLIHILHFTRCI